MDTETSVGTRTSADAASPIQQAACIDAAELQSTLGTPRSGLTSQEAAERLTRDGANSVPAHRASAAHVLWGQVKSPLLILLAVAAILSMATGDVADATIILVILAMSVSLGFWNEYKAQRTADSLQDRITHRTVVVRDGVQKEVDVSHVVRGDLVHISLGHVVPADLRLIQVTNLSCDESAVTGESQATDKGIAAVSGQPGLGDLPCCALMGTVVQSGSGAGIAVATGADAVFGRIAASLNQAPPVTSFQKGLAKFSQFLMWVAIVLAVFIFAANTLQHRPLLTGLMFALAIAVGITPQLLPAVVNTSLAAGARLLSRKHVLVKRLVCIEDLGNVDVLVTDKTGTLTNGRLTYIAAIPAHGYTEPAVALLGLLSCETDFAAVGANNVGQDPLDAALAEATLGHTDLSGHARLDLRPFDHDSRTNAVLIQSDTDGRQEVIKGAPESVLALCSDVDPADSHAVEELFDQGARVVAVAVRALPSATKLPDTDTSGFTLAGYLNFSDEPKQDAKASIDRLNALERRGEDRHRGQPAGGGEGVPRHGAGPRRDAHRRSGRVPQRHRPVRGGSADLAAGARVPPTRRRGSSASCGSTIRSRSSATASTTPPPSTRRTSASACTALSTSRRTPPTSCCWTRTSGSSPRRSSTAARSSRTRSSTSRWAPRATSGTCSRLHSRPCSCRSSP
jgi:Mg2+-importing ATPase